MAGVTSKVQLAAIDGTPKKRLFMSIISDYDLTTGLCELVDNAFDLWMTNDRKPTDLKIEITLNWSRQLIEVRDNAGGVKQSELELLVAPGATRNDLGHETIGTFGVGGKRAAVALGEQVEIRTRAKGDKSLQLDITAAWLATEDWDLAPYEIPDIVAGTTTVDISKLRKTFNESDVDRIRKHLGETYQWFLKQGCRIDLNGSPVSPVSFDHWAYPPDFKPRTLTFPIEPADGKILTVNITAGLITDRDPARDNYGVYFYCNHRLVVKELQTRDVGYRVTSEAGVPHPDASLCRVIIDLQGPAEAMPWNSSKSGLNFNHPAFDMIRPRLIYLVTYFTRLSRRLKNDWEGQVFAFPRGEIEIIEPDDVLADKKIVLPKLPRGRKPSRIEEIKELNKSLLVRQPWTVGLVEALGIVDIITKQKFDTKNRAALILLDSNFEISLKEFIVNHPELYGPPAFPAAKLAETLKHRAQAIAAVRLHATISDETLAQVNYFYNLRNKLIHERASVGITDTEIENYKRVIEKILKALFKIKFPAL